MVIKDFSFDSWVWQQVNWFSHVHCSRWLKWFSAILNSAIEFQTTLLLARISWWVLNDLLKWNNFLFHLPSFPGLIISKICLLLNISALVDRLVLGLVQDFLPVQYVFAYNFFRIALPIFIGWDQNRIYQEVIRRYSDHPWCPLWDCPLIMDSRMNLGTFESSSTPMLTTWSQQ